MACRVLVIEEAASRVEIPLAPLGASSEYRCERVTVQALEPTTLLGESADVIVPVALPRCSDQISELFTWLKGHTVGAPTLAILSSDADDREVCAAAEAVDDFMFWPAGPPEVAARLARLVGSTAGRGRDSAHQRLSSELGLANLVGCAPAFVRTLEQIPRLAQSDGPVLITGETGTGKELCARALHHLSRRRAFPFVPVDCGAYPDHLFENELFGHVRGAYTDAQSDQKGLAALAEGGTLFLDEVDALSPAAQSKLLRFLQERTYKPLGSERFARADVRVMAATNGDLESCVREQRFRSDLFYRLSVLLLHLAPLRERCGDVPLLARHFLAAHNGRGPRLTLSAPALRKLSAYDWPGNVRELQNVVQRAAVLCDSSQVLPAHVHLPNAVDESCASNATQFREARAQALATFERRYVADLLEQHSGNVTRAAAAAGKERRAFGRLVKRHGLKASRH